MRESIFISLEEQKCPKPKAICVSSSALEVGTNPVKALVKAPACPTCSPS